MDSLSNSQNKKAQNALLKSLLFAKVLDKVKLKEYFLDNFSRIPQEHRLTFWKLMLGIWNKFPSQYLTIDSILQSHYEYLKQTIRDVLKIGFKSDDELNYCIYLLDRDMLPLHESDIYKNSRSFCIIFKQISEILDDANDFELYYISTRFYEYLRENLKTMQEKFYSFFHKDPTTKNLIQQIDIDQIFLTALAGVFKDISMYHLIWDRIIVGEFDLLVFTMIAIFENFKDVHLKHFLVNPNSLSNDLIQKLGHQDETKVFRTASKYYKNLFPSTNLQLQQSTLNNYLTTSK